MNKKETYYLTYLAGGSDDLGEFIFINKTVKVYTVF